MPWAVALEAEHTVAPWDEWVRADPLWFVKQYPDPRDQEIVGLIAAGLAYGRVGSILPSVEKVLAAMDRQPFLFTGGFHPERDAERFAGFAHRFHTSDAIIAMLHAVQQAIQRHGSLREMFLAGYSSSDETTQPALGHFVASLRGFTEAARGPWVNEKALYGWRHFLATPSDGSACKRLNLYLRWVVRTGLPDVGAWPEVCPSKLLIPVDVHVANIARALGWSTRSTVNARMAHDITRVLRGLDSDDPIRYDFVLSHLGMEKLQGRLR